MIIGSILSTSRNISSSSVSFGFLAYFQQNIMNMHIPFTPSCRAHSKTSAGMIFRSDSLSPLMTSNTVSALSVQCGYYCFPYAFACEENGSDCLCASTAHPIACRHFPKLSLRSDLTEVNRENTRKLLHFSVYTGPISEFSSFVTSRWNRSVSEINIPPSFRLTISASRSFAHRIWRILNKFQPDANIFHMVRV